MANDSAQELVELAANCAIYEADRLAGPTAMGGSLQNLGLAPAVNLDRDFYGQDFASGLTSPGQAIEALEASKEKRVFPLADVEQWRNAFKIDGDQDAVIEHWEAHNREVTEAIARRARHLLEVHHGKVEAPKALAGLFDTE
jgi:hypothetical protein